MILWGSNGRVLVTFLKSPFRPIQVRPIRPTRMVQISKPKDFFDVEFGLISVAPSLGVDSGTVNVLGIRCR